MTKCLCYWNPPLFLEFMLKINPLLPKPTNNIKKKSLAKEKGLNIIKGI